MTLPEPNDPAKGQPQEPTPDVKAHDQAQPAHGPGAPDDRRDIEGWQQAEAEPHNGAQPRVGMRCWGDQTSGHITAITRQLCIFVDDDGQEHAERWPAVMLQAAWPEPEAIGAQQKTHSAAPGFAALDAETVERLRNDPYQQIELRMLDVEAMMNDLFEQLPAVGTNLRSAAFHRLREFESALLDLSHTRTRDVLSSRRAPGKADEAEGGAL